MTTEEVPPPGRSPSRAAELAVLVVACVLPTLVTLAYFVWARGSASHTQQLIFLVAKLVQFGLPVVWIGWVCRERLTLPKWTSQGIPLGVAFGVVVGLTIGGLYWSLMGTTLLSEAIGPIQAKVAELGLNRPWKFAALGVFYSLVHSLLEEYYWRWFVFSRMARVARVWVAIVVSSLAFAAHHVVVLWHYFSHAPLAAAFFSLSVAVGGVFWAWLYRRTGSIVPVWMSHLCVDAAIFTVGMAIAWPMLQGS